MITFDPAEDDELPFEDMGWTVPQYTRAEVNAAGRIIAATREGGANLTMQQIAEAVEIMDNWRASHSFPLNTLQIALRRICGRSGIKAVVAQRVKRLPSIVPKLEKLNLTQIQDLGGCRAIVPTVADVYEIVGNLTNSRIKHKLLKINDYIEQPKPSGYRGIHLVYSYYSDKNDTYNGMRIEIQVRSRQQHYWSTAVETVGAFTHQDLKAGRGEPPWLRFFALMGTVIAGREGCAPVPGTHNSDGALVRELRDVMNVIDCEAHLRAYRAVASQSNVKFAYYYLLELDTNANKLHVQGYKLEDFRDAVARYRTQELAFRNHPGKDVVLVSADSISALKKAYPNYFLDIKDFLDIVFQETGKELLDADALE